MTLLRADLAPEPRTLVDIIRSTAAAYGSEPAVDDGDTALSYDELLAEVQLLAERLRELGVGEARVAVVITDRPTITAVREPALGAAGHRGGKLHVSHTIAEGNEFVVEVQYGGSPARRTACGARSAGSS